MYIDKKRDYKKYIIPTVVTTIGISLCIYGAYLLFHCAIFPTNEYDLMIQNRKTSQFTVKSKSTPRSIHSKYIIGQLEIPKINIKTDIYFVPKDKQYKYLRKGVVSYSTKELDGLHFLCIAGHNMRYGDEMFTNLHKLNPKDTVQVKTLNESTYNYEVLKKFVSEPTDLSLYDKYNNTIEGYMLLITCTNNGKQRLLILLKQINH